MQFGKLYQVRAHTVQGQGPMTYPIPSQAPTALCFLQARHGGSNTQLSLWKEGERDWTGSPSSSRLTYFVYFYVHVYECICVWKPEVNLDVISQVTSHPEF